MSRRGYSILEAIVAMGLFAIGILALSHSYFAVVRSQLNARQQELATQCAKGRIEEILNSVSYSDIDEQNFPDEGFGNVDGGAPMYTAFSRNVSIRDSLNAVGMDVLKEVTVQVNWQTPNGLRDVTLSSVIAYHKDIKL